MKRRKPRPYRGLDVMVTGPGWTGREAARAQMVIEARIEAQALQAQARDALAWAVRRYVEAYVAPYLARGDRRELETIAAQLDGVRVALMMESARIQLTSDYCQCRTQQPSCRPRCACECHRKAGR